MLAFGFAVLFTGVSAREGGGLALYWDASLNVSFINFGEHYIDIRIEEADGQRWRCTFVYGEPIQDRPEMWKLLRRIKQSVSEPWLMVGDFNEAM